jgi:hypothetical protein
MNATCINCGGSGSRLRNGRCPACYAYRRRSGGRERPSELFSQSQPRAKKIDTQRQCAACLRMLPPTKFRATDFVRPGKVRCLDCRRNQTPWDEDLAGRYAGSRSAIDKRSRAYGLTALDYTRLHADQDGRCAICRRPAQLGELVIDHHHASGQVRGLLCSSCNTGIGLLGDDADTLRTAAVYVERRGNSQTGTSDALSVESATESGTVTDNVGAVGR